jgi:hypothetical protein
VRHYRVYRVDGAGRFVGAEWLEADDDERAVEAARNLNGGSPCEVWDRNRFVGAIPYASFRLAPWN